MATDILPPYTFADLLHGLGDVPPERVLLRPAPGEATEADLLRHMERRDIPCELVDGTLVEKAMGYPESTLALHIAFILKLFLNKRRLGILAGADGAMRLMAGLVRVPDLSFVRKSKLPGGKRPTAPLPDLVPCLAVEVLSRSNSAGEIKRKLKDYFLAGTELAWVVDPRKRTVSVYTAPDKRKLPKEDDTLTGGDILPGFSVAVSVLLDEEAEVGE